MRFSIGLKIQSLVLISLLGMVATAGVAAFGLHTAITEARALKTRDLVQTAHSILRHFEEDERAGRMDRAQAQAQAVATVRSLRYAGNEYFFIIDSQPHMIVHPLKPELDGKDLGKTVDPTGKALFRERRRIGPRHLPPFTDGRRAFGQCRAGPCQICGPSHRPEGPRAGRPRHLCGAGGMSTSKTQLEAAT